MKNGGFRAIAATIAACTGITILVAAIAVPVHASAPQMLREMGEAFVEVAQKVSPAVVNISSSKKIAPAGMPGGMQGELGPQFKKDNPFREFFGDEFFKRFFKDQQGKNFRQQGMGSGVIVSSDGTILTNSHVVKDADEIKVTLPDKRSFSAKVIGEDPESDIAVIKIDAKDLPIAETGDSGKMRVGEIVVAIGNPFGLNNTVTSGIVSATGRTNVGIIDYEDFIQTDAAINPGNSGGPLVNIEGKVIGINTAIASRSGGYQGIGFAIPSNTAKQIMESLLKDGKVRRGLLGVNIQDLSESLAESFERKDARGALVSQVIPDSPAEKAGIKSGDIILELDGQQIENASQLKNLVGKVTPGSKVVVTLYRDKKTQKIDVVVAERDPSKIASKTDEAGPETSNELGLELEKVPAAVAEKMGLKEDTGLRVAGIDPEGLGRRLDLRPGDIILEVNGKPVSDVAGFNKAVVQAKDKKLIRLKVQRGKAQIFLGSRLG